MSFLYFKVMSYMAYLIIFNNALEQLVCEASHVAAE